LDSRIWNCRNERTSLAGERHDKKSSHHDNLDTHTLALIAAGAVLVTAAPLRASETDDRIESSLTSQCVQTYLKDDAIKTASRNGSHVERGSQRSKPQVPGQKRGRHSGVQRVDNRIKVNLEGTENRIPDQSESAKRPGVASHVSGSRTEVDIRDGVITLRGAATSDAQKDLATEYAEDVKGVLRVTNVMTVIVTPAKGTNPRL